MILHGEGENVVVSQWGTNQTSDTPVARVSNDVGATFGPMLRLGMMVLFVLPEKREIQQEQQKKENDNTNKKQ